MAAEWYCQVDGNEIGPLTATELKDLAVSGGITPLDWVRKSTEEKWRQAAKVKGLFDPAVISSAEMAGDNDSYAQTEVGPILPKPQQKLKNKKRSQSDGKKSTSKRNVAVRYITGSKYAVIAALVSLVLPSITSTNLILIKTAPGAILAILLVGVFGCILRNAPRSRVVPFTLATGLFGYWLVYEVFAMTQSLTMMLYRATGSGDINSGILGAFTASKESEWSEFWPSYGFFGLAISITAMLYMVLNDRDLQST